MPYETNQKVRVTSDQTFDGVIVRVLVPGVLFLVENENGTLDVYTEDELKLKN